MPLTSTSLSQSVIFCHIISNGRYLLSRALPHGAGEHEGFISCADCGLTEQAGEKRDEDEADECDAATGHKLLHALTLY